MLFEFYLNSVKCILSETKFLSNVYEMHISSYFNECTRALVERCGGGWRQVVIGKNWPLIFRYMKKKFPQTWDQWYTFKSLQVLSEENLNWNLTRNPWKKEEEMVGFLGGKEYSSLVMYKEECKAVVLFANFT